MPCQKCNSERVLGVSGKTSDMCSMRLGATRHSDYVTYDLNLGGGDYLEFDLCLECGQLQGKWPVEDPEWAKDEHD